ncbi:Helix-hairpin-helix domain-containing protein [Nitrosomonas aestuarii]|uniref:Helix-hairpin-helix domain-containing protein n=1 Tax=Nitrosomonas aestuarii TaxID=52441 RepID=A0A1I4FGB6_9PROT|nr:helix-hairpin-helix domain-containing protein [Nitrosomonas aestuarii]SFL15491.1 Helix-hairpin-helix domain-containing protein [Nitrosomonas aestuarii]
MAKLTDVVGIGPVTAKVLADHHIKTPEALAAISIAALEKVPGFSNLRAKAVKKAAAVYLLKNTNNQTTITPLKQTIAKEFTNQNTTTNLSSVSPHNDAEKIKNNIKKDRKKDSLKNKTKKKIKKKEKNEEKDKTKIKKEKKKKNKKKIKKKL